MRGIMRIIVLVKAENSDRCLVWYGNEKGHSLPNKPCFFRYFNQWSATSFCKHPVFETGYFSWSAHKWFNGRYLTTEEDIKQSLVATYILHEKGIIADNEVAENNQYQELLRSGYFNERVKELGKIEIVDMGELSREAFIRMKQFFEKTTWRA